MKLSSVSLGMAIAQLRKDARMSAADLAAAAGMTPSSLSRTENGLRAVELAEAELIAQATGRAVGDLLELARLLEKEGHVQERIQVVKDMNESLRSVQEVASKMLKEMK